MDLTVENSEGTGAIQMNSQHCSTPSMLSLTSQGAVLSLLQLPSLNPSLLKVFLLVFLGSVRQGEGRPLRQRSGAGHATETS